MKVLKNFIQYTLFAAFAMMAVSCSSDQTETTAASAADVESNEINTRGMATKVSAKAYYYKSLATFADGAATLKLEDIASLEGKQVNLVVLYEANAPWAAPFNSGKYNTTGDDKLNGIIASYEMEIVKQFSIDDENEGFVLEANGKLEDPVAAARELSLVDHVLMVHVKEVPVEEETEETASNN